MSKNVLTGLLVGANFRPPSKLFIECLPAGAPLTLEHEPDNEYDSNAIKVHVAMDVIPQSQHSRLESELPNYGWDYEDFLSRAAQGERFFLGYIAASGNKQRMKLENIVENILFLAAKEQIEWDQCKITLGFHPSGLPLVVLSAEGSDQ